VRGRRRRRALRWAVAVVAVVVLVLAGGWVALGTDVLAARSVDVVGNRSLADSDVRRAAAVPMGTPLARLDTRAVARRVRTLAPVDTVSVERTWPHTVTVRLTERTPVAYVPSGSGGVLLDRSGVAYRRVPSRPAGLPVVKMPGSASPSERRAAATVAAALTGALRQRLVAIEVPESDRITLRLSKGLTVRWGSADRSDRKATVTTALLSKDASLIDVTSPEVVTVR
jgi:cell division protein FtsQ